MAESPIRVLLIDDHVSSWSLSFVLAHQGDLNVVATAPSWQPLATSSRRTPHLMLRWLIWSFPAAVTGR